MYKLPCKIYRMYCIWLIVVIGFVLYQRHSSFLPFYQRNGHSIFHSSLSPETGLYPALWIPETKLQCLLSLKIAIYCSWKIVRPWKPETELSSVSENSYILYLKKIYLLSWNRAISCSWSPETELSSVSECNYILSLKNTTVSFPWNIVIFCPRDRAITCPWIPETELSSVYENSHILSLKKNSISFTWNRAISCSYIPENELSIVSENRYVMSLEKIYLLSLKQSYLLSMKQSYVLFLKHSSLEHRISCL